MNINYRNIYTHSNTRNHTYWIQSNTQTHRVCSSVRSQRSWHQPARYTECLIDIWVLWHGGPHWTGKAASNVLFFLLLVLNYLHNDTIIISVIQPVGQFSVTFFFWSQKDADGLVLFTRWMVSVLCSDISLKDKTLMVALQHLSPKSLGSIFCQSFYTTGGKWEITQSFNQICTVDWVWGSSMRPEKLWPLCSTLGEIYI